ncbi:MAG: sugar transferase [Fusobacterium sp. JB019]|nr:sugar transferase [Fusobacterium sp. JB019]
MLLKRLFDVIVSFLGIIFFLPLMVLVGIIIKLTSKGPILFKQIRVTKNEKLFEIYKFRTMRENTEGSKQITIGADKRITKIGKLLRVTKIDELPQLLNVFKGDMSFVGPRPEVPRYVKLYSDKQKEILKVRAGITDYASIIFSEESEILGKVDDPEKFYIEKIMPYKIDLNKRYLKKIGVISDIKLIIITILKIIGINILKEETKFKELI